MFKRAVALASASVVIVACQMPKESQVARPPDLPVDGMASPPKKDEPGRKVSEAERWAISDPQSVKDLQGTPFGEREIREFWTRKGWRMTKSEEKYLAETKELAARGSIVAVSRWATCPYTTVYRAKEPTKVMGIAVDPDQEFHFEMCDNDNEVQLGRPQFRRRDGYKEDHDDGHATDPSKKPI